MRSSEAQAIAAAEQERAGQWAQAALADPAEQARLAQVWRVSLARVRVLAEVWRAARRSRRPVGDMLGEASLTEWSVRDLAQVGRSVEAVSLATVCGGCGFRVVVSRRQDGARAAFRGKAVRCPVCPAEQIGRLG